MDKFKVIMKDVSAEVEEKKSRFLADIFYVESVEDAEEHIRELKKRYFDARHHCYAYRIIEKNGIKERQSDDGEPSGTAGAPILNILSKNNLCQILVVVTRYFGGTLLGTGGLIRAYSEATLKALENGNFAYQELGYEIEIVVEYKELEKLSYYCSKRGIEITNICYETNVTCIIEANFEEKEELTMKKENGIQIIRYAVLREKYITAKSSIRREK